MKLLAETIFLEDPSSQYAPLYNLTPSRYVTAGVNLLLGASGVAAFLYLLWGGFQWVTAGGDKEAVDKAKKKITTAFIGLIIVFSVYVATFVIKTWFGVDPTSFTINNI